MFLSLQFRVITHSSKRCFRDHFLFVRKGDLIAIYDKTHPSQKSSSGCSFRLLQLRVK